MRITPRVQFSGRPSGAPSELDANLIRGHLYPTDNPYPKQPNPRPQTITYFQPFLVQRLGSTSLTLNSHTQLLPLAPPLRQP
jgi:hypothetical protein